MNAIRQLAKRFMRSDDGPTTVEYAVMLALIVMVCMTAIGGIGTTVSGIFTALNSGLPSGSAS
ncbi:MAG: Flp family type IVb pilin [Planctomycetes bacterium]|nr:Flp family type IVb pilin [Planctomycetota bacterium]MBI3835898.1 Flp family type IVb pilin [Planctomycetota bacterium]